MQKNKQKILWAYLALLITVSLSVGTFKVHAENYPPPGNASQTTLSLTITGSAEPPPDSTTTTPPPTTTGGGGSVYSGGGGGGGGGVSVPSNNSAPLIPTFRPAQTTPFTNITTKPELTPDPAPLSESQKLKLYRQKIRQARLYAEKIKKYDHLTKKQRKKIYDLYVTLYKLDNRVTIPESFYPKIDDLLTQLQLYVEKNETMIKNDKSKINQIKKYAQTIKKQNHLKSPNKNKLSKLEKKLDALLKTEEISLYDNENLDNLNRTFKLYAENKKSIQIDIYGSALSEEETKSLEILVDAIDEDSLELKPDKIRRLNLENAVSPDIVSLDQIADIAQKEFRNAGYESENSAIGDIGNNTNITTTILLLWIIFLLLTIIKQQNEN